MLQRAVVIVTLEAEQPGGMLTSMATSDLPFDRWFRRQLLEFHGLDVTQPLAGSASELIFAWQTNS
jgi:hypothetical protein